MVVSNNDPAGQKFIATREGFCGTFGPDQEVSGVAEPEMAEARLARLVTPVFKVIELLAYVALGVMLSAAAALALGGAALVLWQGIGEGTGTDAIFSIIDRLLFVLLLVEILHTITASIKTGGLTSEPFLVVGLIASIRRVLVITLQTSQETKSGEWNGQTEAMVRSAMVELGVLGALILILVVSLYLIRKSNGLPRE